MRLVVAIFFIVIVAVGCRKSESVKPVTDNSTSTTDNTSKGGPSTTPPDTTPKLTHDDSIHMAAFKIPAQVVTTSVSGTNLILTYSENADLLFTAEAYQKTSAVHLTDDFKNTLLTGFDFTTVAEAGNTTLNWVDDNLNNITQKTVKDTVINKVNMVKINVHRKFTFFRVYASNAIAINEQNIFISRKDDVIAFTSYCYYNQKNYQAVSSSAKVGYVK
jgi:hypothetical protein